MQEIQISIIKTPEQWHLLKPQWNLLLESSRSGTCFLTFQWLKAWSECFMNKNDKLYIITFHEKDSLIGAAPFYIHKKKHGPITARELKFIGTPQAGSDYLDVIIKKSRETKVANALYGHLIKKGSADWDILSLHDIPSASLFLLHFLNRIEKEGKYVEITPGAYCPVTKINGSFDDYFSNLSKWRKKKFKQDFRIIHRDQNVRHVVGTGKQAKGRLSEFFEFYNKKSNWPGEKLQQMLNRYIEHCESEPPVQIDLLQVNGKTVAGLLHLKHKNALAMYLMVIDKDFNPKLSLGNLLVGMCIENATMEGYTIYDFLKGDETYKFHWANEGKRSINLKFYNKNPAGITLGLTKTTKNAAKLLLR